MRIATEAMLEALTETLVRDAEEKDALLIAGPTASGKSALAIAVAKATGGLVINADSMQIYEGIRLLTARPTPEEEAEVEHRLYGIVDPRIAFSAGDYVRMVAPLLAEMRTVGRLAIIVGGTGLYFRALTDGLAEVPAIPADVMAEVEAIPAEALHGVLLIEDPEAAARLSPADVPRLQRALSVWRATGQRLGAWREATTAPILSEGRWAAAFLSPQREALYKRIDRRFETMIAAGALDEVAAIRSLGLPANRGVMKAHGMPHLVAHLDGRMPIEEAVELGQRDTRHYARRQFTWARRFMGAWRWLEV